MIMCPLKLSSKIKFFYPLSSQTNLAELFNLLFLNAFQK